MGFFSTKPNEWQVKDMKATKPGLLLVVSGPSGVGKGTVCKRLLELDPNIVLSVSATTRRPRAQEIEGVHYYFISLDEFIAKRQEKAFLEWAEVYGNYYGTLRALVDERLQSGQDVILEIDTQGAMQVRAACPDGVFVFIMPPSFAELRRRIVSRATESTDIINLRLSRAEFEMSLAAEYNHSVINHVVDQTALDLRQILLQEKQQRFETEDI